VIALAIAVSALGLGGMALLGFQLWLREGRHILADLRNAEARLNAANEKAATEAKRLVDEAAAKIATEATAVRSEMNQLAAAIGLQRRDGAAFTAPPVRSVLP
jgi:hypothetical protein